MDSISLTMAFQSVTASNILSWSLTSCVVFRPLPMNSLSTLVVTWSNGEPEKYASPMAPMESAAPGPVLVISTPGLPVARA